MDRIVIPPFEGVHKWTVAFCKSTQWMTSPLYLADDLYQECFFVWQKISAEYVSRPSNEQLKLYKMACRNRVRDIVATMRSKRLQSIDTVDSSEVRGHDVIDRTSLVVDEFFEFVKGNLCPTREPNFTFEQFERAVLDSLAGTRNRQTKTVIQDYINRLGSHRIAQFLTGAPNV